MTDFFYDYNDGCNDNYDDNCGNFDTITVKFE